MNYDIQQGAIMHTSVIGCIKTHINNSVSLLIVSISYLKYSIFLTSYKELVQYFIFLKLKFVWKTIFINSNNIQI